MRSGLRPCRTWPRGRRRRRHSPARRATYNAGRSATTTGRPLRTSSCRVVLPYHADRPGKRTRLTEEPEEAGDAPAEDHARRPIHLHSRGCSARSWKGAGPRRRRPGAAAGRNRAIAPVVTVAASLVAPRPRPRRAATAPPGPGCARCSLRRAGHRAGQCLPPRGALRPPAASPPHSRSTRATYRWPGRWLDGARPLAGLERRGPRASGRGARSAAAYHLGQRASSAPPAPMAERALAHASEPRQPLALLAAHRALGELGHRGTGSTPKRRTTSTPRWCWPTPAPPPTSAP